MTHHEPNPPTSRSHADARSMQDEPRFYTTGEAARECGVTVRTIQYWDRRALATPSGTTSGGRRLYSEEDIERLHMICFLRSLGLPLGAIGEILSAPESEGTLSLLLERQESELRGEVAEAREKLAKLGRLRRGLAQMDAASAESIGVVADMMNHEDKLKKMRMTMLATAVPVGMLELGAIWAWFARGRKWPAAAYAAVAVPWSVWASKRYLASVAYVCPSCHAAFQPSAREAIFAGHTPTTRTRACPECGQTGWCVEVWNDAVREDTASLEEATVA